MHAIIEGLSSSNEKLRVRVLGDSRRMIDGTVIDARGRTASGERGLQRYTGSKAIPCENDHTSTCCPRYKWVQTRRKIC